jgi:hypothetical protein
MSLRILADDGSVHQFPDGTSSDVISSTLARYHETQTSPTPSNPDLFVQQQGVAPQRSLSVSSSSSPLSRPGFPSFTPMVTTDTWAT